VYYTPCITEREFELVAENIISVDSISMILWKQGHYHLLVCSCTLSILTYQEVSRAYF